MMSNFLGIDTTRSFGLNRRVAISPRPVSITKQTKLHVNFLSHEIYIILVDKIDFITNLNVYNRGWNS